MKMFDLVEADHWFWVNADDVETPAVTLEETSEQPQEDAPDLLILEHTHTNTHTFTDVDKSTYAIITVGGAIKQE